MSNLVRSVLISEGFNTSESILQTLSELDKSIMTMGVCGDTPAYCIYSVTLGSTEVFILEYAEVYCSYSVDRVDMEKAVSTLRHNHLSLSFGLHLN